MSDDTRDVVSLNNDLLGSGALDASELEQRLELAIADFFNCSTYSGWCETFYNSCGTFDGGCGTFTGSCATFDPPIPP